MVTRGPGPALRFRDLPLGFLLVDKVDAWCGTLYTICSFYKHNFQINVFENEICLLHVYIKKETSIHDCKKSLSNMISE